MSKKISAAERTTPSVWHRLWAWWTLSDEPDGCRQRDRLAHRWMVIAMSFAVATLVVVWLAYVLHIHLPHWLAWIPGIGFPVCAMGIAYSSTPRTGAN